jgi:hypothetical protein
LGSNAKRRTEAVSPVVSAVPSSLAVPVPGKGGNSPGSFPGLKATIRTRRKAIRIRDKTYVPLLSRRSNPISEATNFLKGFIINATRRDAR